MAAFCAYLRGAFGPRKARNFAPHLARLIRDDTKRAELLESAATDLQDEPAVAASPPIPPLPTPAVPLHGREPSLTEQLQDLRFAAQEGAVVCVFVS